MDNKGTIFDENMKAGDTQRLYSVICKIEILGMFAKSKIESSMKMALDEFANYAKKYSEERCFCIIDVIQLCAAE